MSWFSKVVWSEGLFLRPHHLQQSDRYVEHLVDARTRLVTPYPWGFSALEFDLDLAQQSKFSVKRATGIMPDGTPFDIPADSPPPPPIDVPDNASRQLLWLTLPLGSPNSREVDEADAESASRFHSGNERLIDSTAALRVEEDIDVAHPRLAFDLRKTAKPGFACLPVARVIEVRDKAIILDQKFVPPVLTISAHPTIDGWLDRVIGWIDNKLEELARYAADPSSGGGMQNADYLILMLLNRNITVLNHLDQSRYVHPERFYIELLRLVGEMATFAAKERRARTYPAYDHDDLETVFEPVLRDLQAFLLARMNRQVVKLDLVQFAPNAYAHTIRDRGLFQHANFVIEVAAKLPLTEIAQRFPQYFKIGPNTKMSDIVHAHLPGVGLQHLPTPPPQLRIMPDHVYFLLDKTSPLWREFSTANAIGLHFADEWPGLQLDLWAITGEQRR